MKRKEIKWRREGRGTMIGRQDGIIFRIFRLWDAPERGHTVSCYDTRGTGREISTAGYREFTWEEAVEFCQKIAAGEVDLEDLRARFDAEDMAKEREAVRKTTEKAKRLAAMLEGYGMKYTDLLELRLCATPWGKWDTRSLWATTGGRAGRMGPDEKDTGKIAIYEEPDGTLVGIMDGEIQEIYPGEERPGVYLEGEAIDDIREKAGEMCISEDAFNRELAEKIAKAWNNVARTMEAAAEVFTNWIRSVAAQIEAKHELETAMRWASCYYRPAFNRYRHTKKKRTRKKYEKKILAWYREEVLGKW